MSETGEGSPSLATHTLREFEKRIATLDTLIISLGSDNDELRKDRNQALEKIEGLRKRIVALEAQVAKMPVVVGYVLIDDIPPFKEPGEFSWQPIIGKYITPDLTVPVYLDPPQEQTP